MLRLPTPSTLFPYTTLFRSELVVGEVTPAASSFEADLSAPLPAAERVDAHAQGGRGGADADVVVHAMTSVRSEEHTSELQSPCKLVCSLLLDKKKIQ